MIDSRRYTEMFDYLSTPKESNASEPLVAFGRKGPLVAIAVGDLAMANLAEIVVITGGIGKDSGDIREQGYRSEAHYLDDQLTQDSIRRGYICALK